ncbi:MAG TPA: hypothetical protein VFK86_06815, partial [Bauldia sp.]|nr:hypothetical protein [Bauldia sp.]
MLLLGLGTIGLLALLIAIATAAIVLSGATEVGLIRDRVQAKLEQKLGPAFEVTVAGAAVSTDPELGLVVDLRGIELAERDGGINVSFPATRLAVDPLAFLGFGSLVTKAEISEPRIQLTRRPDGGFGLRSFGQAGGSRVEAPYRSAGGFPELSVGAAGLDQAITEILADNEDLQLVVTQGAIELRDPAAPTTRISEIDVRAAADGPMGGISVDLSARGRSGPWTASLGRQVEAATGQRILSVEFAQITLGDLRDWFGGAPMAASADIPLYGAAEIALAANGTIENAVARLDLGAGVISFGGSEEAVLLDEASIRARWDNSRSAIV